MSPPETKRTGPRLYHQKSRQGCQRCRARRVKCDETHPACANCSRHSLPCYYDRQQSQQDRPAPEPARANARKPVPILPWPRSNTSGDGALCGGSTASASATASSSPRRRMDLRLLHHFVTSTSHTLPSAHLPEIRDLWSIEVPRIAFDNDPLLNGLFALSASHMAKTGTSSYELVSAYYSGEALRGQQLALKDLKPQSADVVCFTSVLFFIDAFAALQDRDGSSRGPPSQWMHLVRGTLPVFEAALGSVQNEPSSKLSAFVSSALSFTDRPSIFRASNRDSLAELVGERAIETMLSAANGDETVRAYELALAYIGAMYLALKDGEHPLATCRRLMIFPILVPPEFAKAVDDRKPQALLILAHFFAFAIEVDHVWWVGKTARNEVLAIRDQIPLQWRDAMHWPVQRAMDRAETVRILG